MNKEFIRYDQTHINKEVKGATLESNDYSEQIDRITTSLVESAAKVKKGEKVLIYFDSNQLNLVHQISEKCREKEADVSFLMRDLETDVQTILFGSDEEVKQYFAKEKEMVENADNIILIRSPENPEIVATLPKEKQKLHNSLIQDAHRRRMDGEVKWTLMYWPTSYEATKEGLSYDEYFKMFIEACDQPWEEIRIAQEKLIEKLDKGKKLELYAKDTFLSMSIEDMTFCNSTITRNFPGSEVFSAPVLKSVNGQIYAQGEYIYDGHLMKNIHICIKDGRITEDSYAEKNDEAFQEILNRGEGSRYFGEVALGTNPGLIKRLLNPLYNEKVAGSFHLAIGRCYTYDLYEGKSVNVKNGNDGDKTNVHWDLTILMHDQNGKVILDGEIISQNGRFLDPELAILNPKI